MASRQREIDRVLLAEKKAEIRNIEEQIRPLLRSLSELQKAKDNIQKRLDAYKYPVLTLPADIVCEIFLRTLPPYPKPPPLVGLGSPTSLAQISRTWREIALAYPTLWRAVNVEVHSERERYRSEGQANLEALWLERSASCPLSVYTGFYTEYLVPSPVLHHRERWDDLAVIIKGPRSDLFGEPLPLLSNLFIHLFLPGRPSYPTIPMPPMPLLHTATLQSVACRNIALPWAQLTSLTLLGKYPDFLSILPQTSHLVFLELHLGTFNTIIGTVPEIPLLHLETLVICKGEFYPEMLCSLRVPSLHTLHIGEEFLGKRQKSIETLQRFISHSDCQLQDLYIWSSGASDDHIQSYSDAFPSISKIVIDTK
ncbi:F-box domain-containing protein [Favolaschia claudopus]|uniref:F-box domain-containing protein n=1 Tax=Favolaschia claudopus TaxID=2862362 RepID=A0AAV9ZW43_9AGAR